MLKGKYFKIILEIAILLFLIQGVAFAVEDGFVTVKKISGNYFTVFCEPGVDVLALTEHLNIGPTDRLLAGQAAEGGASTLLLEKMSRLRLPDTTSSAQMRRSGRGNRADLPQLHPFLLWFH